MASITRRQFSGSASMSVAWSGAAGLSLSACAQESGAPSYEAVAAQTWRADGLLDLGGERAASASFMDVGQELIRCATLAPSSHNTQCWKFALANNAITILPDLSRRCPAVDPDDHHVFVSLGCATENLVHAALAHGLNAEPRFDAARDAVDVSLSATPRQATPLFQAIATRQCTRGDYDGKPLTREELALLERAGTSNGVRMLLLTERPAMERVLDWVVQGNNAQMADAVFVKELKSWIRFSGADAVRTRDGLFSAASGNPVGPAWIGKLAFDWLFTPKSENEKIARQIRSSSGMAVFVGAVADKAHWIEVGRCYERFALQATALGIRNAFLNQPVEVAAVRSPFAEAMGLVGARPDLVVRFGRGPSLPRSLRRPLQSVLV
jgi:hypothetical protein